LLMGSVIEGLILACEITSRSGVVRLRTGRVTVRVVGLDGFVK